MEPLSGEIKKTYWETVKKKDKEEDWGMEKVKEISLEEEESEQEGNYSHGPHG